jgi:hypothetical protein
MGGDFGSNGSVVWNVWHGSRGNPTGPVHEQGAGNPGNNGVKVGPDGTLPRVRGKDEPTPEAFFVSLRFANLNDAASAWATAILPTNVQVLSNGRGVVIRVRVPRTEPLRTNRNQNQPLEVQVDW